MKTRALFLILFSFATLAFRPIQEVDDFKLVQNFVPPGETLMTNFLPLLSKKLMRGKIDPTYELWADHSWRTQNGGLAERYGDGKFNSKSTEGRIADALSERPLRKIVEAMVGGAKSAWDHDDIQNNLSPAEKYDLLLGDLNAGLTLSQWTRTQNLLKKNELNDWNGICEGSAGSSIYFPEAVSPVTLFSSIKTARYPFGIPVTFNARDIRGLTSTMFSQFVLQDDRRPVLGRPCNEKADPYSCFDVNPGSFFVVVTNWIGRFKEPIVADVDPGKPVWNLPMKSYKIKGYFNPNKPNSLYDFDEIQEEGLKEILIPVQNIKKDRFKNLRSPNTAYVIGVDMEVSYGAASGDRGPNGSQLRANLDHRYKFDLELDDAFRVIGGEWYGDERPDFLWVVPGQWNWGTFYPTSIGDQNIDFKDGDLETVTNANGASIGLRVPDHWREVGIQNSSPHGQPLLGVVRQLLIRSKK